MRRKSPRLGDVTIGFALAASLAACASDPARAPDARVAERPRDAAADGRSGPRPSPDVGGATGEEPTADAAAASPADAAPADAAPAALAITAVTYGSPFQVPNTNGDTWTPTVCGDGVVYSTTDDGQGFQDSGCDNNFVINRFDAFRPFAEPFKGGKTINCMREYGTKAMYVTSPTSTSPLRAMWKSNGMTCVRGPDGKDTLLVAVSRHRHIDATRLQDVWDATIIESRDQGVTWTMKPPLVASASTFVGRKFSTPYFVQYGDGYKATADGADEFIYAVSSDGQWDNGNEMYLARLPRAKLGQIRDGSAWEFLAGVEAEQPRWAPATPGPETAAAAKAMLRDPGKISMTGVTYLEGPRTYVMIQWYYPVPTTTSRTVWTVYQAPRPWGPWTAVPGSTKEWAPHGYYGPASVGSWFVADGPGKGRLLVATAGDYLKQEPKDLKGNPYYRLNLVELQLSFAPR